MHYLCAPTEITKIAGPAKLQMAPESTESQQLSKRRKMTESQSPRLITAFIWWFNFILGFNSIFCLFQLFIMPYQCLKPNQGKHI